MLVACGTRRGGARSPRGEHQRGGGRRKNNPIQAHSHRARQTPCVRRWSGAEQEPDEPAALNKNKKAHTGPQERHKRRGSRSTQKTQGRDRTQKSSRGLGSTACPPLPGGGPADGASAVDGWPGHVPMTLPHVKQRTGIIMLDGGQGQHRARETSPTSKDDVGEHRRGVSWKASRRTRRRFDVTVRRGQQTHHGNGCLIHERKLLRELRS